MHYATFRLNKSLYICKSNSMMKYILSFIFICSTLISVGQTNKEAPPLDISPMDMSYFPVDYSILKIQGKISTPPVMRVIYSRPHKAGREIFGGLLDYGEVWRVGANEATEIDFFRDVRINNKLVPKGRYTLYAIPYTDKWTVIINKETDIWGAFRYDSSKDLVRIDVPVSGSAETENMTIIFQEANFGANMNIYWTDVRVSVPITF